MAEFSRSYVYSLLNNEAVAGGVQQSLYVHSDCNVMKKSWGYSKNIVKVKTR